MYEQLMSLVGRDRSRAMWGMVVGGLVLLGAWVVWAVFAQLPVYVVSQRAQVESTETAHAVSSVIDGQIETVHVRLGDRVGAGEPVVTLSGRVVALEIEQERARVARVTTEIGDVRAELAAVESAVGAKREAGERSIELAESELRDAQRELAWAKGELEIFEELERKGASSQREMNKVRTDYEAAMEAVESAKAGLAHAQAEHEAALRDEEAHVAGLRRTLGGLEGELAEAGARVRVLEAQRAEHVVRAAVGGEVALIGEGVVKGGYVEAGQTVVTVLPEAGLRVVARFSPGQSVGRVQVGQEGRMRLEGFSWVEYGMVPVRVTAVASEADGELVRVELEVTGQGAVELVHGMPATVEVEVERRSPVRMLMRALGAYTDRAVEGQ